MHYLFPELKNYCVTKIIYILTCSPSANATANEAANQPRKLLESF